MKKYKYRNTKTGATIRSSSRIRGKNWIEVTDEVETEVEEKVKEEVKEVVEKKTIQEKEQIDDIDGEEKQIDDIDGVTKKEIMQELDAMGIEYNSRATKKELYNLMMQGR